MTYERFTERARQVMVLAHASASKRERPRGGESAIQTVDLLRAMAHEDMTDTVAFKVLQEAGVSAHRMDHIRFGLPTEPEDPAKAIRLSVNAQGVIDGSLREALSLGMNYVGTEHLLLSLIRHGGGSSAATVLAEFRVDTDALRQAILIEVRGAIVKKASVDKEARPAEEALDQPPSREALGTRVRGLLDERLSVIERGEPVAASAEDASVIRNLSLAIAALEGQPPPPVNWIGSTAPRRAS